MTDTEKVERIAELMDQYEGWHLYSPEDSWRLERDIRRILGMPQVEFD